MTQLRWAESAAVGLRHAAVIDLRDRSTALVLDADGRVVAADESTSDVLGVAADTLVGLLSSDLSWRLVRTDGTPMPDEENPAVVAASGEVVTDRLVGIEMSAGEGLSTFGWYAVTAAPVRAADGTVDGVVTTLRDVSDTDAGRKATASLARSVRALARASAADEARFRLLAENAADVVVQTDVAGRVVWVSPSVREVLGWDPDSLLGSSIVPLLHPEDREMANERRRQALARGDSAVQERLELRYSTASGHWRWMSVLSRAIRDSGGRITGGLSAMRDIQDDVAAREELRYLAGHDSLTGLLNRDAAMHALTKALTQVRGTGRWVGVLYLDVDRFKEVNDTYGHQAGDHLLVQLGHRLTAALRDTDAVARLGGDEFLVVLPAITARRNAEMRAQGLLAAIAQPSEGGMPQTRVSIGVVTDDGTSEPSQVLREADAALYRAKNTGRGRVSL